jgi:L-arabinonolactonase
MAMNFEVALDAKDDLGEGPWWSVSQQALWRVDILAMLLHRWVPATGQVAQWTFGSEVGFAVPADGGSAVVGVRSGLVLLDLASGEQSQLASAPGPSAARFNDGKTDRRGNVWAGTIANDQSEPKGVFGRLVADGFTIALDGIGISNGLGWSPDNETMYHTDSSVGTIWAFDYDSATAAMSNRRVFAVDDDCEPDGLTVDAEGGVWSAKWDGARVVRYSPDGSISEVIDSPVSRPTSCMFGGPDLDTLYVTSARAGLDDAELAATPAGSVLAVCPGVSGLPETEARLP